MRDSINYNLKYFIMKMSSTKPMKNTMRKQSPLKFITSSLVTDANKRVSEGVDAMRNKLSDKKTAATTKGATTSGTYTKKKDTTETSVKSKTPTPKPTATTKPVEGKPSSRPGSTKPKGAFAGAASKAAKVASKVTPMQMKKKC